MTNVRRLTGKYYFKLTWFGEVLMVQCYKTVCYFLGDESPDTTVWRKATKNDIFNLNLQ